MPILSAEKSNPSVGSFNRLSAYFAHTKEQKHKRLYFAFRIKNKCVVKYGLSFSVYFAYFISAVMTVGITCARLSRIKHSLRRRKIFFVRFILKILRKKERIFIESA